MFLGLFVLSIIIYQLERSRANGTQFAHHDAFGHSLNTIFLSLDSRLVQDICSLLERGKHEGRGLHLGNAETLNSKDSSLASHDIS